MKKFLITFIFLITFSFLVTSVYASTLNDKINDAITDALDQSDIFVGTDGEKHDYNINSSGTADTSNIPDVDGDSEITVFVNGVQTSAGYGAIIDSVQEDMDEYEQSLINAGISYEKVFVPITDVDISCNNGSGVDALGSWVFIIGDEETPKEECVHDPSCASCGQIGSHAGIETDDASRSCYICGIDYYVPNCKPRECEHDYSCLGCGNPNGVHPDGNEDVPGFRHCDICGNYDVPNCQKPGCEHDYSCLNCGTTNGSHPSGNEETTGSRYCHNCGSYSVPDCYTPDEDNYTPVEDNCYAKPVACPLTHKTPSKTGEDSDYYTDQPLSGKLSDSEHIYRLGDSFSLTGNLHRIINHYTEFHYYSINTCQSPIGTICSDGKIDEHNNTHTCNAPIYDPKALGENPDPTYEDDIPHNHAIEIKFTGFEANEKSSLSITPASDDDIKWYLTNQKITKIIKTGLKTNSTGTYGEIKISCKSCLDDGCRAEITCTPKTIQIYFNFFSCHIDGVCTGCNGNHLAATYIEHPINGYVARGDKHTCPYCGETYYTNVSCNKGGGSSDPNPGSSTCHTNDVCSLHKATYTAHPQGDYNEYIASYKSTAICPTCGERYYKGVTCSKDHNHDDKCNGGDGHHTPIPFGSHPFEGYHATGIKIYCPICNKDVISQVTCSKKVETLSIKSIRDLRWQSFFTKNNSYQGPLLLNPSSSVLLNSTSFSSKNTRTQPYYNDYPYLGMGYAVELEVPTLYADNNSYIEIEATILDSNGAPINRNQMVDAETGALLSNSYYDSYFKFNSKSEDAKHKSHFLSVTTDRTLDNVTSKTYSFIFMLPPATKIIDYTGNHVDVQLNIKYMDGNKEVQTYQNFLKNIGITWSGKVFSYSTTRSLLDDIDNDLNN